MMKFAVLAALALATANAQVSETRCNSTTINPWVSTTADPGKSCLESSGFRGSGYASPNETSINLVCKDVKCRAMLETTLSVRPAIGDCFVAQNGTRVNLYEKVILPYAEACKTVLPPTTEPPVTTPPPVTTAPTPSDGAGTIKPVPTTQRPQC